MEVAFIILFLGVLIILGNVFNRVCALTKIPDLLILIGIGILLGPVLGVITPDEYGIVGPLFATITLAVIPPKYTAMQEAGLCDNKEHQKKLNHSIANNHSNDYPGVKTSGIKLRGTGAATKGVMARGPMA